MNLGIHEIASFVPDNKVPVRSLLFENMDEDFINNKLGFQYVARKDHNDDTSDLCVKAFEKLKSKCDIDSNDIDCVIVCTQNPDQGGLPHTSSIVHKKLSLNNNCAVFDISLGCSGYVYCLSIMKSFMQANSFKSGILFTSDPYSKIIDPEDKNTAVLFGDAATATLINHKPKFEFNEFIFGSNGSLGNAIEKNENLFLRMNGRAVFNFTATVIPDSIMNYLNKINLSINDIDLCIFHQGSKFIVDTINKKLGLTNEVSPFLSSSFGNTISSSIPIILENYINSNLNNILLSGFGVGLSWATTCIYRVK